MLKDAERFWDAISGKVKGLIQSLTQNTYRCERYEVTTAPNGTVMGVTLPMGTKELFLPYSLEVSTATVGRSVLVVWWGSMSNARVCYYADGFRGTSYKFYRSVNDIGLTAGSTTIAAAWAAMPSTSVLICYANQFTTGTGGVPNIYGTVEMVRRDQSRGWITFHHVDGYSYEMAINTATGVPRDTWFKHSISDYELYDSVTDLGLTAGSASIAGAWAAMPNRSILIAQASDFSSAQLPSTIGTVDIVKHGVRRGWVFFHHTSGELFSMALDTGNDTVSGVWSGAKQYVYRDITSAAFDLNAGANNYGRTVAIPTVSGYTPIGIISARLQGTGYAACAFNGYYLSGSNVGFGVMNNGSVNRTGLTAIFRVLYEISEITVS